MSLLSLLTVFSSVTFLGYGLLCVTSVSMEREFTRFGLAHLRVFIGSLEILGGIGLLVGLAWTPALWLASGGLGLLMLCGVVVRVSVSDSLVQMLPALGLMVVNAYIFVAAQR